MSAPPVVVPSIPGSPTYLEDRRGSLYAGTITLCSLATIVVCLRFAARKAAHAAIWWDDWLIIPALLSVWGITICSWCQIKYAGYGRHAVEYGGPVTDAQQELFFKILMPHQMCYFLSTFFFKTSIILLYYRIFGVSKGFRKVLWVAWIFVLLYFIADVLAALFECHPIAAYWNHSLPGGTCVNTVAFYRWNGVANLLLDFFILMLTAPMIWRLSLKTKQKVQLTALFLLGAFVCVASVIRVTTFSHVNLADITYTLPLSSTWSTMEQGIGVICACLPVLPPLFRVLFKKAGTTHGSGRATKGSEQYEVKAHSDPSDNGTQGPGPSAPGGKALMAQNQPTGGGRKGFALSHGFFKKPGKGNTTVGSDTYGLKTDYDNDMAGFVPLNEGADVGVMRRVVGVDAITGGRGQVGNEKNPRGRPMGSAADQLAAPAPVYQPHPHDHNNPSPAASSTTAADSIGVGQALGGGLNEKDEVPSTDVEKGLATTIPRGP